MLKRTSLRMRLTVLMICLTALPVVTVTWLAAGNTRSSVEKEIVRADTSRMLWADQYMNELIEQIDILFYTLQIDQELMRGLGNIDNPDPVVQYQTQELLRDKLTSAFHANSRKVDDLTLYMQAYRKAFTVNYTTSGLIRTFDIAANEPWSRISRGPVNMYFKQTPDGTYAYHGINRFEDRALIGGISVRIDREVWQEVGRILRSEPDSLVYVLNDEGELLSGSSELPDDARLTELLRGPAPAFADMEFERTDRYFVFQKRIGDGQLAVIKAVPLSSVSRSARPTIEAGIWTGALFAAASALLSVLVSLGISRPIVRLARTMRTTPVQGFESTSVISRDEIGLLERGYNSMMERIRQLIEDEYEREIEVKDAQLLALQAQINPHFLNNTLHMIGGMALKKKAPEIYEVTRVIGDLLRYAIGSEDRTVPIADELTHTRNYLFIQERRFAGRCTIELDADPAALEGRLPKFTLQPIVENAFEHGLQRKPGSWRLAIRIRRIGGRIVMLVLDEGAGMQADELSRIRAELRSAGGARRLGASGEGGGAACRACGRAEARTRHRASQRRRAAEAAIRRALRHSRLERSGAGNAGSDRRAGG
ncbi:sensor histidine kinase [Cohnella rhizosphaerae]|uniref:Histidine kinase n=1 Tax=Cohnella rhizosphaerae TaxID=1457232 RepID=A0A9X4QX00_9BACL|nr:histidine kinase [Cohnella rhizosphaerae]MDG0814199.1 histidine kinase [Cohnella rhizosphaerae]